MTGAHARRGAKRPAWAAASRWVTVPCSQSSSWKPSWRRTFGRWSRGGAPRALRGQPMKTSHRILAMGNRKSAGNQRKAKQRGDEHDGEHRETDGFTGRRPVEGLAQSAGRRGGHGARMPRVWVGMRHTEGPHSDGAWFRHECRIPTGRAGGARRSIPPTAEWALRQRQIGVQSPDVSASEPPVGLDSLL